MVEVEQAAEPALIEQGVVTKQVGVDQYTFAGKVQPLLQLGLGEGLVGAFWQVFQHPAKQLAVVGLRCRVGDANLVQARQRRTDLPAMVGAGLVDMPARQTWYQHRRLAGQIEQSAAWMGNRAGHRQAGCGNGCQQVGIPGQYGGGHLLEQGQDHIGPLAAQVAGIDQVVAVLDAAAGRAEVEQAQAGLGKQVGQVGFGDGGKDTHDPPV